MREPPQAPGRVVWRQLRRNPLAVAGGGMLVAFYALAVGLVGIAISFALGLCLGGVSGYFGGWVDAAIMRLTELLLTVPAFYLIIALRAVFPADLPSGQVYLAIVAILALIGWAGLARVIRGMVLSIRRSEFVLAAEALGMSRARVIARHVLPNTVSFVIVAATIAVPGYILGEVVLSFLGVGVQEPSASWGRTLHQARGEREELDVALDPATDSRAARQDRGRGDPVPRPRPAQAPDRRDARDPRQGDLDDLPGAHDLAQPRVHLRGADHRSHRAARARGP